MTNDHARLALRAAVSARRIRRDMRRNPDLFPPASHALTTAELEALFMGRVYTTVSLELQERDDPALEAAIAEWAGEAARSDGLPSVREILAAHLKG